MKKVLHTISAAIVLASALVAFGAGSAGGPQGSEHQPPTPACSKCGDGYCAKQCGETATSCPKDCGVAY